MKLNDVIEALGLSVLSDGGGLDTEISGGYTSDLLSDVMGNVEEGMVWLTLQVHRNIVAVASLKEVAAILLINGAEPDAETCAHAAEEGVTMLSTNLSAFEASGKLYELLK